MKNPYIIVGVGFLIGILSGFLGLGGGVVLVPIMASIWRVEQHIASATSLAVVIPTGIVGSIMYQQQGNLDIILAAKIIVGSIVGAYLGSTVACRLPEPTLRKLFGGLLIIVGMRMVVG